MGAGYSCTCKKCGMKKELSVGTGMLFEFVREQLKEEIKEGKYGKELQQFLADCPDCSLSWEQSAFLCGCGYWDDGEYIECCETDKIDSGKKECRLKHICPKCGKEMQRYPEEKIEKLRCYKCGGEIESFLDTRWD